MNFSLEEDKMARSNNDLQQVAVLNLMGREARYALIGLAFASGMLPALYSLYPRHFAVQGPAFCCGRR